MLGIRRRDVAGGDDILDLIGDAVVVRDPAGRVLAWNRAAADLYGWTAGEAIGQAVDALLATTGMGEPSTEGGWRGECGRRRRDGGELVIDLSLAADRDAAGTVTRIVETARDVTAAHAAREASRAGEYRYRNMFDAMAVAFWEVDFSGVGEMLLPLRDLGLEGLRAHLLENHALVRETMRRARVVDVNRKTVELFGAPDRAAMIGGDVERYWPVESEPVFVEALVATLDKRAWYQAETVLRGHDGRSVDALFTVSWSPENRRRAVLLLGIVDIGERKRAFAELERSEARYRLLFQHVPIALWQIDASGIIALLGGLKRQGVSDLSAHLDAHPGLLDEALATVRVAEVNDRTVALFGGTSPGQFAGPVNRFWRLKPDTFRRSLEARFRGDLLYSEQTQFETLDGRVIDVVYSVAFPEALGALGMSIIGTLDVGDRVRAEQTLARVRADFAHAARVSMLGELTASIAHEVNQPLAAISAYGQASLRWLKRAEPDLAELATLAEQVVEDAQRASDIIARIRGMAMKRDPDLQALSLGAIIEEAVQIVRHELIDRSVRLSIDLAPGLPPVLGDRVQLQQVIVNLAVNAIQAMAGGPDATLAIRTLHDSDGVLVTVSDTGPGIPPDQLGALFAGFFTTKPGGMGMGLAICRSIIEGHGGTIRAENGALGACFTVRLPAAG
jgi:PAS domain S-box-containing protein